MANIVVGANRSPKIIPHSQDCGFLKTILYGSKYPTFLTSSPDCTSDCFSPGMTRNRQNAVMTVIIPDQSQKVSILIPSSTHGPTTNCPAVPPSIPMHCVKPTAVARDLEENPL